MHLLNLRSLAESCKDASTVENRAAYADTFSPATILELLGHLELAVSLLDSLELSSDPHPLRLTVPDETTVQAWITARKEIEP